jgi:hypothetical protein
MNIAIFSFSLITAFSVIVVIASYITSSSFLGTAIVVCAVALLASIVHFPDGMPGEEDNLDGKSLHPFKMIFFCVIVFLACYLCGYYFPELYTYPKYNS